MKFSLELFEDCSDFEAEDEMNLSENEKKLSWTLHVDGEAIGMFTYGNELMTVLNALMELDEKFIITKK